MIYLADTHIVIFHFESHAKLSPGQQAAWRSTSPTSPMRVSEISLWEIANLVHLGRVRFTIPLREWLDKAIAPPIVEAVRFLPAIAAEVAALPRTFHRDPADRIVVATARVLGATLLTNDRLIIDSGLVPTLS